MALLLFVGAVVVDIPMFEFFLWIPVILYVVILRILAFSYVVRTLWICSSARVSNVLMFSMFFQSGATCIQPSRACRLPVCCLACVRFCFSRCGIVEVALVHFPVLFTKRYVCAGLKCTREELWGTNDPLFERSRRVVAVFY